MTQEKKNKIKKGAVGAILTALLSGSAGATVTGGLPVRLEVGSEARWYTRNQYENVKTDLLVRYFDEDEIRFNELKLLGAVLDREVKKGQEDVANRIIKKVSK